MPNQHNSKFPRNNKSKRNYKHFHKANNFNKKKRDVQIEKLLDEEVGITEYVSDLTGFSGIIKARFSDFQVNEIDRDNRIAKYSNKIIPDEFQIPKINVETIPDASPEKLISQENWQAIINLVKTHDQIGEPVNIGVETLTKDERKSIHKAVKNHFGQKIISETVAIDNVPHIQVKLPTKSGTRKDEWPEGIPEYVHFVVYKEFMDTSEVCFRISKCLKIPTNKITYAGTKDKRAKTSQWFCIRKVLPGKLLGRTRSIRSVRIGNFELKDTRLKLGDLKGNHFRIALRNVIGDDELIVKSLEHLKQFGFINYYGTQRFGADKEVPTHVIGLHLLRREWKEAINLILKVKPSDDPDFERTKAKQHYAETSNAAEALKIFDKDQADSIERKLLEGLAKCSPNNYVSALEKIPRNIRLIYLHAFQSLIWNKMASKRIQLFGLKPYVGDLVYVDNFSENNEENKSDTIEELTDSEETESDTSYSVRDAVPAKKEIVKSLTADNIDKYTIFDIVLPGPGHDVIYPENMLQYYKEALEAYNLTVDMPKQSVKAYNVCGNYRKLLCNVENLEWKTMYYNDPLSNLILSDLGEVIGESEPKSVENGQYKALILSFSLRSSSYATMLLREILKCNSSSSEQAKLNNYYRKSNESSNDPVIPKSRLADIDDNEENISAIPMNSLLADKEKYELFKKNLFNFTEEDPVETKRKLEQQGNDEPVCKKVKVEDE